MKEDFIQELVDDLKDKIKWTNEHPNKPEQYCHAKEDYDSEEDYTMALKSSEKSVNSANARDKEVIKYYNRMIEKVKQLKKNPTTDEEKKLWLEVIVELRFDFQFHSDSRNEGLGWAGEIILKCVFDMEEENEL